MAGIVVSFQFTSLWNYSPTSQNQNTGVWVPLGW